MAENEPLLFKVNGRDYPMPTSFTVGEMCDAERYFGVEFGGETGGTSMRMVAAMLWIAIRREHPNESPTELINQVRDLPPEVFTVLTEPAEADAGPPEPDFASSEKNGSSGEATGGGSPQEVVQSITGTPALVTGATSDQGTSLDSPLGN